MRISDNRVFPRFTNIGDSVSGTFESYVENVPSNFGPENILSLRGDQGETIIVRCKVNLSRTIREHRDSLPGKRLTITFYGEHPSTKGNPTKLFHVDVDE
jgi:hypothetical protein